MTAVLGQRPPAQTIQPDGFVQRIIARDGLVFVANDEAHHTHDEESEWNRGIRRLHAAVVAQAASLPAASSPDASQRLAVQGVLQLNVSATPRYSLVAADNEFEKAFSVFLEKAPDVARFAKLPERFGFTIPYTDSVANLRYYEPDFIAVTTDGVHHLIETKGREDIDVKHKDRAAQLWCENASLLTGTAWVYQIVHQKEFEKLRPDEFSDLVALELISLL